MRRDSRRSVRKSMTVSKRNHSGWSAPWEHCRQERKGNEMESWGMLTHIAGRTMHLQSTPWSIPDYESKAWHLHGMENWTQNNVDFCCLYLWAHTPALPLPSCDRPEHIITSPVPTDLTDAWAYHHFPGTHWSDRCLALDNLLETTRSSSLSGGKASSATSLSRVSGMSAFLIWS